MNIVNIDNTNFKAISLKTGGMEFLKKEGGTDAICRYNALKDSFSKYKWKLNIDENGYSFESPRNYKTYTGPFSVKRKIKTDRPRMVIRMNDSGRANYVVPLKTHEELENLYKKIKNAKGLEKMLLLLAALERCFKDIIAI